MPVNHSNDIDGDLLKEPLALSDLLSSGKHFEINSSNKSFCAENEMFDDFGLNSSDEEEKELDPEILISPWQEPFDKLKPNMIKINNFVYKRVVHSGIPESELVPDKARVSIQYTSYAENTSQTSDSTYLRGKPQTFHTGSMQILPGIEQAVRTMQLQEESQFIISYHILYGELGCPPRIPPKTDFLFVIKVLFFVEVGDAEALNQITTEERNIFKIIYPKVKEVHKKGIDFFMLKNYQSALKAFHSAINSLMICRLSDENEEKEYKEFMIKLYTNLATIYSISEKPAKVCSMCNEMRSISIDLYKTNVKALYREGKAYSDLGDFEKARRKLLNAKDLQPTNEDINNELEKLNTRKTEYSKRNQEFCSRALSVQQTERKDNILENSPFKEEMIETLEAFKDTADLKEFQLPDGLSASEIHCVEDLVKKMGLKISNNALSKKKLITKNS